MAALPNHVVFIPDGNRRWAQDAGLQSFDGHQKGVDVFHKIVRYAADRGVKTISLWGMSLDNFSKRSPKEVAGLLKLFRKHFEELLADKEIHDRKMRVRVFGRWQQTFPKGLRQAIEAVQDATAEYDRYSLNLFLAYNGTDEMVQAVQDIVEEGKKKITEKTIKEHLFTKDLPPVDLLIRTGGEPHLSAGFMMWDMANAELYFTKTLWPDFGPQEFDAALDDFAGRRRMQGK